MVMSANIGTFYILQLTARIPVTLNDLKTGPDMDLSDMKKNKGKPARSVIGRRTVVLQDLRILDPTFLFLPASFE